MKDYWGEKLAIGDVVIQGRNGNYGDRFIISVVVGFTPKRVRIVKSTKVDRILKYGGGDIPEKFHVNVTPATLMKRDLNPLVTLQIAKLKAIIKTKYNV
jgi:hypothetical protein